MPVAAVALLGKLLMTRGWLSKTNAVENSDRLVLRTGVFLERVLTAAAGVEAKVAAASRALDTIGNI